MLSKRLILCDDRLLGLGGHCYSYARRVLMAARISGYEIALVCSKQFSFQDEKLPIYPTYRLAQDSLEQIFHKICKSCGLPLSQRSLSRVIRGVLYRIYNHVYQKDMKRFLHKIGFRQGDHIFFPNADGVVLKNLLLLIRVNSSLYRKGIWHILLRWDVSAKDAAMLKGLLHSLALCLGKDNLCLYTDTEALSSKYQSLFELPFQTLPVPLDWELQPSYPLAPSQEFRIAYLGEAREEKGFQHLKAIVSEILMRFPGKRVRLTIQAYAPSGGLSLKIQDTLRSLEQLQEQWPGQIDLKKEALSDKAYQQIIKEADLLLFPYCQESYQHRSSGILVEALGCGIPVLVTEQSWLSREVERYFQILKVEGFNLEYKAEDFSFDTKSTEDFLSKFIFIQSHIDAAREVFSKMALYVQKEHASRTLVDLIEQRNRCRKARKP